MSIDRLSCYAAGVFWRVGDVTCERLGQQELPRQALSAGVPRHERRGVLFEGPSTSASFAYTTAPKYLAMFTKCPIRSNTGAAVSREACGLCVQVRSVPEDTDTAQAPALGRRRPARPECRGVDSRPCLHSAAAGELSVPSSQRWGSLLCPMQNYCLFMAISLLQLRLSLFNDYIYNLSRSEYAVG